MSITLPTYTRREAPLLGRGYRVRAIAGMGLRREFRRPAAIFAIGVGTLITTVSSIVQALFAPLLLQGQPLDIRFFYLPASNPVILFFVALMAGIVGSGLIADDLDSMALSLYLSRPITHEDYLLAKASILAPLLGMITVFPLVLTPLLAALLGYFPWTTALEAMGRSFLVGALLTAFFTSVTLLFSSLTRRKAYAAAAIYAVTFGLTIPVEILASPGALNAPSLLYLSPWQAYLAVARAAFGVSGGPIDWAPSFALLLAATILAALATVARMRRLEVMTG